MDPPASEAETEDVSARSEGESSPTAADTEESPRQDSKKRASKKSLSAEKNDKNDLDRKKSRKGLTTSESEGGATSSSEPPKDTKNGNDRKSVKVPAPETSDADAGARKSVVPPKPGSDAESTAKDAGGDAGKVRKSLATPKPGSDAESSAKAAARRRTGGRSIASSDAESLDESDASNIRDMMKKKRSMRESGLADRALGDSGVPEFQGRLAALRMTVQHHDLPMQLAYDELDELADKAERVRSAIETNMSMLSLEMKKSELRYLRSGFTAWKLYADKKQARRLDMVNAAEYNLRRMVARAFQAWRIFYLREQKFRRLQASAERLIQRHLIERIWRAWTSLVRKRLREDERHRREKQLVKDLMVKQRETVGRRAVQAIRRRRLHWVFAAFKSGIEIQQGINMRNFNIRYVLTRNKVAKAFKFWANFSRLRQRAMRAEKRAQRKLVSHCFWFWEDDTAFQKYNKRRMGRRRMRNAFGLWSQYMADLARHKLIIKRSNMARLRRLFKDFREGCLEMRWRERTRKRAVKKCDGVRMRFSFQAWVRFMQMRAHKRMIKLEDYAAQLEKENQRTRAECDRLGRVVDSGEWDQQRVAELEQASQILSGERDALTKLVGRLERDRLLAMEQQNQQDMEIKHLKEQIMGTNFMHRNKLLVRGASSFNSVVRAVKSEVLKKGVNPDVVYSIDNMSMDQVSVFPDGDLRVKPLNKFDKGKWGHRSSTESTKAFMEEPLHGQMQSPGRSLARDHAGVY